MVGQKTHNNVKSTVHNGIQQCVRYRSSTVLFMISDHYEVELGETVGTSVAL